MIIKKQITVPEEINITDWDAGRCSRDCLHCGKSYGQYCCHLRGGDYPEPIENLGKEDVDDENLPSSETYGFARTKYCQELFGAGE